MRSIREHVWWLTLALLSCLVSLCVRFLPLLAGTVLAPLPATRRGYGIVLNASPKADKIIYTNGRVVVVRSLAVSGLTGQRD
jgi:hypothetical protein